MLVQEEIHSSQHRKEKGMVIKLDLANAFDRVRHNFLFDVMYKLGFGQSLINWIKASISDPWIAPLVNGRAVVFFKASRGLRQGCPLSPLLFVIQASALSFYLNKKQQDQAIPGLCIARGVKCFNHALFADDTLLLGVSTPQSAINFKAVLDDFCKISGSVLNKGKCQIFSWNTSASTANSIARCLGFATSTSWSSFKYLGLPIFNKRASSKHWSPQLDKFLAKMQVWGSSWLNIAGKAVLIKATLSSLSIFKFSVLLALVGIIKKMEELIRQFFWKGGKQNDQRFSLINWETVTKPTPEGGLNFKDLKAQNLAMGSKLIWKIIARNPNWAQIALWKKYFRGTRLRCLDQPKNALRTLFSNFINKFAPKIKNHSHWIPGNGKRIQLLSDRILDRPPLEELGDFTALKTWLVEISFARADPYPRRQERRKTLGKNEKRASYTVKQGYSICLERPHVPPNPAPWVGIWNFPSIPKINHFCWILCHQKIITEDRLQKRGFNGPSRCILCKANSETALHLMIECWMGRYPGTQPKNKTIILASSTLPKFISWQDHIIVANSVKCQLREWLEGTGDDSNLSQQDRDLGFVLTLSFLKPRSSPPALEEWKIRKNEKDFQDWLSNQSIPSLFFDGAAKGNPGKAGVGGHIILPDNASPHTFAWGLGHTSSIQAEALALLQGVIFLKDMGIREANIFGDSQVIIRAVATISNPAICS
eukprot:PITA_13310